MDEDYLKNQLKLHVAEKLFGGAGATVSGDDAKDANGQYINNLKTKGPGGMTSSSTRGLETTAAFRAFKGTSRTFRYIKAPND